MYIKRILLTIFSIALVFVSHEIKAQCKIMEPGFNFLTSSRGCAPFTVKIETGFLDADKAATSYYVNWGDNTPEEQVDAAIGVAGVTLTHTYLNAATTCGYDVVIDASNSCNPRGSVVSVNTQVVVWTNDVISIDPAVYRVCQGFAADVLFTDNSAWNCYPRATRENNEARWIQWIYGTGSGAPPFIPGVQINSITPGAFPYFDPAPGKNPIYPVLSPGQVSLPVHVPVTTAADIGKEFEITLKNWNQCNPYDNNLADGDPLNPGDLVNGDNAPQVTTARIVIVDAPQPQFVTKLGNSAGPIQSTFCIGDDIYFDNNTPGIAGAQFYNTWEMYDNAAGTGAPFISHAGNPTHNYLTAGQKLIRLRVKDTNAAGSCEAIFETTILISPSLVAKISITDNSGNVISPDFCQEVAAPFTNFQARFNDVSVGTITAATRWRWEFYDQNNVIVRQEPVGGGFSTTQLGPLDQLYTTVGTYRVRLIIRDNATACESTDEVLIRVFEKPKPNFTFNNVCEGSSTTFTDLSTLNSTGGQQIIMREWDMSYDGVTFTKDAALDNQTSFSYSLGAAGSYRVALRVTTDLGGCSDIYEQTVIVDAKPIANFTVDTPTGCSVLSVTLTNTSVTTQPVGVTVKQFVWEVNDGTGFKTDLIQDPTSPGFTNTYVRKFKNTTLANKTYDVRLRVITVNNCETVSAPTTITIYPGPNAGFVSANYSPFDDNCSPVSVDFAADAETQSLNPSDYQWEVSDANGIVAQVDSGTDPTFTYNFVNATQAIVNFSVTLKAKLAGGCQGDSTRTIRINPVPSSDFTITELQTDCSHKKYHVEAVQKGLIEYRWIIDQNGVTIVNSTTMGDQFDYEFTRIAAGDQPVNISLTTTNFANCQSPVTTKPLVITQLGNINASFTATPPVQTETFPTTTVTITNTTNPGPWTYSWDFGDGSPTSTDPNVGNHAYAAFGTYTITLTVSDGICVETAVNSVIINPRAPVVDFDYGPASGCSPLTVTFTNKSQFTDPSTYVWEFGINQGTSHAVNPTHTYYDPGIYTVTLTASNAVGQSGFETKQEIIQVYEKPQAGFALKPLVIYIPGGKLFTKNETFGADSYYWDFGDASTSTDFEPEHIYTEPGTFDVTMIASTVFGCADTASSKTGVRVLKGGELLIPNAFSPNTGGPGSNGQNDRFIPLMRGVTNFQMMVFNRWGQMLFETTNPENGWDGYFNGKLCPQDVYVYKITAKYEDGQTVTKVGDINLIR